MSLLNSNFYKINSKQDTPLIYLESASKYMTNHGTSLSYKQVQHLDNYTTLFGSNSNSDIDLKESYSTHQMTTQAASQSIGQSTIQTTNKTTSETTNKTTNKITASLTKPRFEPLKLNGLTTLFTLGISLLLIPAYANTPALVAPQAIVHVAKDDTPETSQFDSSQPAETAESDTVLIIEQPTFIDSATVTTAEYTEQNGNLQTDNTQNSIDPNSNSQKSNTQNSNTQNSNVQKNNVQSHEVQNDTWQNKADDYIYAPRDTATEQQAQSPFNTDNVDAVDIEEISKSLEKGSYQTIELQSIVDPVTGILIDDTYNVVVPDSISLIQAQNILAQVSPKLAANNAAIQANELQSMATEDLNKPWVFFRAGATHYNLDADIDLRQAKADINDGINQAIQDQITNQSLDPSLVPDIPPIISQHIPDNYQLEREDTNVNAGLAVFWPVYTAGRTQAITQIADARTDESQADALIDADKLYTTLIDRYFTAQLAVLGAYLSEDYLNTVKETDYMAQRMFEEGFISRLERLEAQSALAEAESSYVKAHNDAELAMTALQRLLRSPYPIKPTTPLFVMTSPLPSVEYFQDLALQNHPGLKKVDAKYAQAESLSNLSDTEYKPTISVFGYHEVDRDPSWIAGVSASWKLWGGINTSAQHAASQAQMRQALLSKIEVSDNILLLVENNWQSVENARVRYQSLNENVALAQELLRLKQVGLREGVNTALDVAEAQTKLLKAKTEQASVANDYVQSLAALMESIGNPHAFNEYMAVADVKLPTVF